MQSPIFACSLTNHSLLGCLNLWIASAAGKLNSLILSSFEVRRDKQTPGVLVGCLIANRFLLIVITSKQKAEANLWLGGAGVR